MGRRWIAEEAAAIAEVRKRAAKELALCPQFPEVVGDSRILRFLRGKQLDVDAASEMYIKFLNWRREYNVDQIRQEIVYGGKNSALKFPNGEKIIELAPQIVITKNALDKLGRPIAMELYNFSPKEVLKVVSQDLYINFLIYALEYRALVMEQLSHEQEMKYLQQHPDPDEREDGYGVVMMVYIIRDLKGLGLSHTGSEGRNIVKAALSVGLSNYPEYMGKSAMTSVPWLFNAMWFFISALLDEFTLAKISLSGGNYMDTLLKDLEFENIPSILGGGFTLYNEPFDFDTTPGGPLYYDGAERDSAEYLEKLRKEVASKITKAEVSQKTAELTTVEEVDPKPMVTAAPIPLKSLETRSSTLRHDKPSKRVNSITLIATMKKTLVQFFVGWRFTLRYCWHEHPIHSLLVILTLLTLFHSDYYSFLQVIFAIAFSGVVLIILQ